jgi:hypothetical protein
MEAMDGLQERLDAAIDANQQALNNLEEAFAALKNQPTDSRSGPEGELHQKMDEALGNLSSGALPLDPQLTKQLQELANPMGAGSDPEKAIQALKGAQQGFESLKKQRENDQGSPNRGSGETKPGGKEGSDKHNGRHSGSGKSGTGENDGGKDRKKGDGASGTSAGKEGTEKGDGVSRGPGEAPLNLFEKPPSMTSQSEVELESDEDRIDDSGEVIDVIRRTPQVLAPDENSGGRDVTLQKGVASATWNDSLTPDEEETLKKVLR